MDFSNSKPREVEAYLRDSVRKLFGDAVENDSDITSSHGYYHLNIPVDGDKSIAFKNFRKKDASKIIKALRALA